MEKLLLIPKPTPYKLRMLYQTTIKQVGLVNDLKIHIHGIPYIFNFIVIDNNVTYVSFDVLLAWGGDTIKKSRIYMSNNIGLNILVVM